MESQAIAFVGYGGVGGARAIEHLRGVAIELQMAPIKHEVNIAWSPISASIQHGRRSMIIPILRRRARRCSITSFGGRTRLRPRAVGCSVKARHWVNGPHEHVTQEIQRRAAAPRGRVVRELIC